ncbi:MAG: AAA family ATPase [Bacilli bacterium]|jgi:hypothetical protein|nr:AAA family ATPase [Bacilli bacterium]
MKKHIRKYLLFNYDNDYRTMIDNNIIGLEELKIDLSTLYNSDEPSEELTKVLEKNNIRSKELKEIFNRFLFEIEIGDVVCLSDIKSVKAIGIVNSNYRYNRNKTLPHTRKIQWVSKETIDLEDGNFRIKIREIEREENIDKIEAIINENLIDEDNGLLINHVSKVSTLEYQNFLNEVLLTPYEVEILNLIYNSKEMGLSLYELNKLTEDYEPKDVLESFSRKVCNYFDLSVDYNGTYLGNVFNGIIRDGFISLLINPKLEQALVNNKIVDYYHFSSDGYSLKLASLNSVYPSKWYQKALDLILNKRTLLLIGPWGCGKSYFAHRLAFLINNSRDLDHIFHLQMHPSLKYEDLLVNPNTRKLYRFIEMARKNTIDNYVIIIEDCHQVDISNTLGELSHLIEDNNRNVESALDVIFSDEKYFIPKNIYVILTSRDDRMYSNNLELSNLLVFELFALYNEKFIKMFTDEFLGKKIAGVYIEVNKMLEKYDLSINHGLFLKNDRGVNINEYKDVVNFKILPILKRFISKEDYQKIVEIIKF